MSATRIKPVSLSDVGQLQSISRQTFIETFAHLNTAEDMKKYLDENLSIERLTNEISSPGSQFYFALSGEQVIGYLKVNFGEAQTELKDEKSMEIERIYVLKEFHGKKVGQFLHDAAIRIARDMSAEYIWLGVW